MKKIGFIAEKGGAGKTTQSYNFAGYLAKKKNKILLVDLDHQLSLTREVFGVNEEKGASVNLFRDQSVKIYNVKDNIDLLPASLSLEVLEKELALTEAEMPSLILSYWFEDHAAEIDLNKYDYIIFDTHPDFGIINKNVVVASDAIISPLEPNLFGWAAKVRIQSRIDSLLQHLINPSTRQPFIETPLFFINNKVEHNTNESQALLEKTADDPQVIATIPNKQLFKATIRKNTPIVDMQENNAIFNPNRKFFENINKAYSDIETVIDNL